MFSPLCSPSGASTKLPSRRAKRACKRRSRQGRSRRSYGTSARGRRRAAATPRRFSGSIRGKPLPPAIFSRGGIPTTASGSRASDAGVTPERPAYTVTFRFKRPDGRDVWLEETAKAEFDALGQLVRLKGLTLDVTARKRSEDQQSLIIAALDHRVKNLLARVAAVAKD